MLSHKSFHVSKVKPVAESDLVPPPRVGMGGACRHSPEHPGRPSPRTRVPVPGRLGGVRDRGSPAVSYWTTASSETSTAPTRISLGGRLPYRRRVLVFPPPQPTPAQLIVLKLAGDVFEVEIPDDHEFKFPNQESVDVISYIRIGGDFKLTSFIC
ncbi:hypothetical protein D4764_18G0003040 [Takifugu flavidus]|uniref:Galectin n=1 Tax=Takifugu flavidus TaxID=433684 RepID=A0A5C6NRY2_9TELE|nr:hypothetical protein D4764_18G0003040 [Takifugu flavidus]